MNVREVRHGYGHDVHSRPHSEIEGSFAYHLRRFRQWYGKHGISQRALAMIAHVSRHFVEDLEAASKLQGSVEPLVRVAIALRRPIEDLIDPERYRALREEIEHRRKLLGGDAALEDGDAAGKPPELNLAVTYRSPHLIMALSDGKTVLELRQYRVSATMTMFRIRWLIEREAKSYGVRDVIVEADTKTSDYVYTLGIQHRTLTFRQAKQHVAHSEGKTPPSNKVFFHALVAKHPELGRYVTVLPATGRVALSERWRTVRLTVATLALAASAATTPSPLPTITGDSTGRLRQHRRPRA